MFGCSDVYHWMGRTAKAIYFRSGHMNSLQKSHNLDATTLVRAPNFGDPAQPASPICASSSLCGLWKHRRVGSEPTGRIGDGVGCGPKKAFGDRRRGAAFTF